MKNTLTIGFSPCPNDTFIFDALVNGKIDTGNLRFEPVLEDVETLNEWAFKEKLAISKLSFRALLDVLDQYRILNAGSALGKGCGPLLVAKKDIRPSEVGNCSIAIPGTHTTANMLLNFAFPNATNRTPVLFSEIERAVVNGLYDLGLIIHESRFTYQEKGLRKIMDLGEHWEKETGCPIPLGGIAIHKSVAPDTRKLVDKLIRDSLQYALDRYPVLSPYVTEHAQEMKESVMRKHIDLYVNNFSLDLGSEGKKAIQKMLSQIRGKGVVRPKAVFV